MRNRGHHTTLPSSLTTLRMLTYSKTWKLLREAVQDGLYALQLGGQKSGILGRVRAEPRVVFRPVEKSQTSLPTQREVGPAPHPALATPKGRVWGETWASSVEAQNAVPDSVAFSSETFAKPQRPPKVATKRHLWPGGGCVGEITSVCSPHLELHCSTRKFKSASEPLASSASLIDHRPCARDPAGTPSAP